MLGSAEEESGSRLGHSVTSVGVGTGGRVSGGSGADEVTAGLGDGVVGAVVVGVGDEDGADAINTGLAEDTDAGCAGRAG